MELPGAGACSALACELLLILQIFTISFARSAPPGGLLLCRRCGHTIVRGGASITNIKTSKAKSHYNLTILSAPNTMVQLLMNPANERFDVITTAHADVDKAGMVGLEQGKALKLELRVRKTTENIPSSLLQTYAEHTWFPDYAWTATVCRGCKNHIGWLFTEDEDGDVNQGEYFHGLVLDYLISETYSDRLTKIPT